MKKPKVIIVGPLPPPAGGVEFVTQGILDSSLAERWELIHCDITKVRPKEKCGKFDLGNTAWAVRHFIRLARLILTHRPVIVYMPVSSTKSGFLRDSVFILIACLLGRKIVGHVHGGDFDNLVNTAPAPLRWWIQRIMRKPDVLIALSEMWGGFLKQVAPQARVEVIPNAVGEDFYQRVIQENSIEKTGKRILFVGCLGKRKGVFDILKAAPMVARAVPGVRFVLVGPEEFEGELKQIHAACKEAGAEEVVEFTGSLFGEDKIAQYLLADIFILPAYFEGSPIVIFEALASGLPIVCTPVGAMPEVVEEGVNGFLVAPGDVSALAERITRLCNNPDLRAQMAAANREKVSRTYRYSFTVERLNAIFSELSGQVAEKVVS